MMQFFAQVKIKTITKVFNSSKLPIFILIACLVSGYQAYSNTQLFSSSVKDTSGTDMTQTTKTDAILPTTDSSKLFANLLTPAFSSTDFNFQMNAEAKFFADNYIKNHTDYFNNMKVWGKPYFDLYDKILSSYGIPVQLKYLSVIESSLSSTAVSWAGAAGPWQIMSGTAREHGLRADYYRDDRSDYIKSTNAACKILKELYDTYGDWLLVIAAYNAGSGTVNYAIKKAHSNNFWDLQYYLPAETRNHVKKFIATHYFFEGDGSIATITSNDAKNYVLNNNVGNAYEQLAANCTTINLYGKYNSVVIANTLMMDIAVFNELNPDIDNVLAKGEVYPLRIPSDKIQLFQSKKMDMLRQSVELLLNTSNTAPAK